ncbi:MAG: penicillin-binding transpeptidase domain-containing protein [Thermotogota bacterium]|nr:penicillin-binding transpeptidase domain-containing protein [Thermotogota bacterium]
MFLSSIGEKSQSLSERKFSIYPSRGIIYDSNRIPLVNNHQKIYYYFDVPYFKRVLEIGRTSEETVLKQIEEIFGIPVDEMKKKLNASGIIRVGSSEIEPLQIDKPLSIFVSVDTVSSRSILYPNMRQIIGKTDSFGSGINGIEKQFDQRLSPISAGEISYERFDRYNRLGDITGIKEPEDGKPIQLSIDLRLQDILQEALEGARQEFNSESAQGIIMETKTGKIAAMYSTLGWEAPIMSVFEAGSAMKPFAFASALKYNLLTPEDTFNCKGKIKPYPSLPTIINDTHAHGEINTKEALANSCNVATIEIALNFLEEMGNWAYYNEFKELCFGKKTGIEMPGEVSGIIHEPSTWNMLTGIQMSIGQGIAVTAIQLIAAVNTIANEGVYIAPTILKDRQNGDNLHRVYQRDVAKTITEMMIETVESGTGKQAKVKGLPIAAKTGTAQKAIPGIGYSHELYVSSFVGFFPADNPVYTMFISLDEPKGEVYYGGDVAAPAFKEVVEQIIDIITRPTAKNAENILVQSWKFPDLTNFTKKDVYDVLETLSIDTEHLTIVGEGLVVDQHPKPETPIGEVEDITIYLERLEVE